MLPGLSHTTKHLTFKKYGIPNEVLLRNFHDGRLTVNKSGEHSGIATSSTVIPAAANPKLSPKSDATIQWSLEDSRALNSLLVQILVSLALSSAFLGLALLMVYFGRGVLSTHGCNVIWLDLEVFLFLLI